MRRLLFASALLVIGVAPPATAQNYGLLAGTYAQSEFVSPTLDDSVVVGPDGTRTTINGVTTFNPARPTSISNSSRNGSTFSFTSADLAGGSLAAFAEATATAPAGSYQPMAMTQAQFNDSLRFTAAGVAADTITLVPFQVEFHGLAVGDTYWIASLYSRSVDLEPGGDDGRFEFYSYGETKNGGSPFDAASLIGSFPSNATFTVDGDRAFITGYLSWIGSTWNPNLNMELRTGARAYVDGDPATPSRSVADFDTATLSLTLPSNVSFTSASGVFPSRMSPVSEPATWAMMLSGFAILGAALRRRPKLSVA